jgi:hypothetical protein
VREREIDRERDARQKERERENFPTARRDRTKKTGNERKGIFTFLKQQQKQRRTQNRSTNREK